MSLPNRTVQALSQACGLKGEGPQEQLSTPKELYASLHGGQCEDRIWWEALAYLHSCWERRPGPRSLEFPAPYQECVALSNYRGDGNDDSQDEDSDRNTDGNHDFFLPRLLLVLEGDLDMLLPTFHKVC